jgi:type I restriction enzyme, S subunit
MNAERLLAHYEQIADAPDSIARLRRFILDLAARGKLVPQDPNDEPASELLKRIEREKARLAKAGEIRKPKPLPAVDEPPFDLPENWRWTRIRAVASDRGQEIPQTTFTYIDVTAIDKEAGVVANPKVLEASEAPSRARKITRKGDVIYSCVRPYLLNVAVIDTDFDPEPIASTAFAILNGHGLVLPRYLWIVLRSPFMVERVEENQRGQAYPAINDADFAVLPFPLPSLAEQHRIVAKVDELMGLCDRLEAARAGCEAVRDRLAAVTLARLNAPDPETFRADARFALDTLPALTARSDQIKQLRQTILSLAVRGKLVPQDRSDKPAAVRRALDAPKLEGRLDAEIPPSWRWVRVEDVADARLGKMLDKAKNKGRPHPYLRNTNVHWFDIRLDDLKTIPLDDAEFEEYRLKDGDVLICEGGHGIGRTAVWCRGPENLVFQKALHRVRPGEHLDPGFFAQCCFVYFDAGIMQTYFTGVGIPHFTGRALSKLVFPLPPLAEQRRIVAKVDELMALCDRLEASLTATDATRRRLLDALLTEALTPAEDRDLEAAE